MPATVYQRVCLKKSEFSRKDLRKIANWINAIYRKNNEEEPPKVEQTEGDRTFMVFTYPDEMIPTMDHIVDKYFNNKSLAAERHEQYLLDLVNDKNATPKPPPAKKDAKSFSGNRNKNDKFRDNQKPYSKNKDYSPRKKYDNDAPKFGQVDFKAVKTKPHDNIPVATTFRKRKTAPGAVSINKDNDIK